MRTREFSFRVAFWAWFEEIPKTLAGCA
jgi:hypothetical protein